MDKWMQRCNNVEAVKDKLVMEQLNETLPSYVRIQVKERKPKTSKEAGEYTNDYFQPRGPRLDFQTKSYVMAHLEKYVDCGKVKDCPTAKTAGILTKTSTGLR